MFRQFRRKQGLFFLFAFIAMVCWGIAPIFAKVGLRETNPLVGLAVRTCVTVVLVTGWLFIRGSMEQVQQVTWTTFFFLALEAVFATFLGDWAYFAAVKKGSVAVLEIIMSCSPIVTIILVGEPITFERVIGMGLIIAGITIVL